MTFSFDWSICPAVNEESECFPTNYDESSTNEWEIEETGEIIRNIFNVFEN